MSDFLTWHPSSENGNLLYSRRQEISKQIFEDPVAGINCLKEEWKFGSISELWDDFVFSTCIKDVLDKNELQPIREAIHRYSFIDELIFVLYLRREENAIRFRRAFWNLNSYGLRLSKKFLTHQTQNSYADTSVDKTRQGNPKKRIAFVLKGPYQLAHVEFLHSFLLVQKYLLKCRNFR